MTLAMKEKKHLKYVWKVGGTVVAGERCNLCVTIVSSLFHINFVKMSRERSKLSFLFVDGHHVF